MGKSSLPEGFSFCLAGLAFCPLMLGFRSLCGEARIRALLGGSGTENAELLARVLHRAAFTEELYTEELYTEDLLHREACTQRGLYAQNLLHREKFMPTPD